MTYQVFTDGGSRGNPGPGACAYVLKDAAGNLRDKCGKYLGIVTNNQAEYAGILAGLVAAKKGGVEDLACFLDSELVVKQVNGVYKIKDPILKTKTLEVFRLIQEFKKVTFPHVRREYNKEADQLVTETLDKHRGQ